MELRSCFRTFLFRGLGPIAVLCCLLGAQAASAADSSGRNSHFWITLRPNAGGASGKDADLMLANGYRSVDLSSPLLTCKRKKEGLTPVYQITWTGNNLLGDMNAETLQFTIAAEAGGETYTLQDMTVNGQSAEAKGFVLESSVSKVKPRKVNGKRARKNYFEIHGSIVLRNPALKTEDPEHPFSDLRKGHTMGPPPYKPTTPEKLKAFPAFSWDKIPRGMLIRKNTAYKDSEIKAIAENYDLVVLEKANGAGKGSCMTGMLDTGARLKKINPDIKVLFYWNSRIFFGHYGIDNTISQHMDEWIDEEFVIRDRCKTYVRENPDFLKWWVGCAEKMISSPSIDGTFVDKAGVPIYMLDALYKATPDNKLVMNNNSSARKRIGYVDGTYREGWSGGHNNDALAETIAIAHETGLNKKMQILRMPVKSATSMQDMEDKIDRGLAIFLLYAEEYSYFYWQADVDARKAKMWEWDASHVDQLNRPLGKPLGSYFRDNNVYTRSFEHCDVYLDLGSEPDKHVARILWKNNIGNPALEGGGMSCTDDTYKMEGSGFFSDGSDQLFYLSDAHYESGGMKARIDSLNSTNMNAQAGIMFRESLVDNAKTVAMLRDPSGKMQMICRSKQGGNLIQAGSVNAGSSPHAMLLRSGDVFAGYCSRDGKNWTEISKVTVPMNEKVEMGMAVTSGDKSSLASAVFSGFVRVEPSKK